MNRDPDKQPSHPVCWRSEKRYIVGLALGADAPAVCIIEAFGEREDPVRPILNRYDVRHLARLPMGTPYVGIVEDISMLLRQPPLYQPELVIADETKVGKPVMDLFAQLKPVRVVITPGHGEGGMSGNYRYEISQSFLLSNLDAKLHDGSLGITGDLPEASSLSAELKDLRAEAGDLVTAVAIAVWRATKRKPDFSSGSSSKPRVVLGYAKQKGLSR